MRLGPAPVRDLLRDRRGVSAIEFAIVFPVLLVLMLMGLQVVLFINATRRVEMIATSISEMISQAAPPDKSTTTATVTTTDLHFAYDAALVLFPYLMKDAARRNISWWQDITVSFASISFSGDGTACAGNPDQSACYVPKVMWTTGPVLNIPPLSGPGRPCGYSQSPSNNTATPDYTHLPRSLYGPGSIITIDVVFTFTPTFAAKLLPALTIKRSVFVQPRYATSIDLDTSNNDGMASKCISLS